MRDLLIDDRDCVLTLNFTEAHMLADKSLLPHPSMRMR